MSNLIYLIISIILIIILIGFEIYLHRETYFPRT